MSGGTVNVSRCLWDDPVFAQDEFSEREAWIWMIAEAAWKARKVRVGTLIVDLKRGQLAHSTRFLSDVWKWHHSKVRRYLDKLANMGLIAKSSDTGVNVISIMKYDTYQNGKQATDTPPTQGAGAGGDFTDTAPTQKKQGITEVCDVAIDATDTAATQERHSADTNNKKGKKVINRDTNVSLTVATDCRMDLFDEFWRIYPHRNGAKKGKKECIERWRKAVKSGVNPEFIVERARLYRSDAAVNRGFGKMPEVWLNKNGWEDDIERQAPPNRHPPPKPETEFARRQRTAIEDVNRALGIDDNPTTDRFAHAFDLEATAWRPD